MEGPAVLELRQPATYLGSETAPDGIQVRRRLQEIEEQSHRRKSSAKRAALGFTVLAVAGTEYVVMSSIQARRSAR